MGRQKRIFLVKLAAIGDVAMACRVLAERLSGSAEKIQITWCIDPKLQALATNLLKVLADDLAVRFVTLDSRGLFQGPLPVKLQRTVELWGLAAKSQPHGILIWHRDPRYYVALRTACVGPVVNIPHHEGHEMQGYEDSLDSLIGRLSLTTDRKAKSAPTRHGSSGNIGVLVGGAQNQRQVFHEKRWPLFEPLIQSLLSQGKYKVTLLGGPEDADSAAGIVRRLPTEGQKVENLVGQIRLEDLPQKLSQLDTFISIDSGLAHIASAVMRAPGQRVITLFGPTNPKVWCPRPSGEGAVHVLYKALSCSPCYLNDGHFNPCRFEGELFQQCMSSIRQEEVLDLL